MFLVSRWLLALPVVLGFNESFDEGPSSLTRSWIVADGVGVLLRLAGDPSQVLVCGPGTLTLRSLTAAQTRAAGSSAFACNLESSLLLASRLHLKLLNTIHHQVMACIVEQFLSCACHRDGLCHAVIAALCVTRCSIHSNYHLVIV